MAAYWVARAKIIDPVEYKKYASLAPAIIASHGGKFLARAGKFQVLEGPETFDRFVVTEFPTFEQGIACFNSPAYQEAASFRRNGAGVVELFLVEGAPDAG